MSEYPANAGQFSGEKLLNMAYVVVIDNRAWEACETRVEALEQICDFFDMDKIRVHPKQSFVYVDNQNPEDVVAWISVLSVDKIDELGLLYLPEIEGM